MKKIKYIMFSMLVLTSLMFVSCKKNEDPQPVTNTPPSKNTQGFTSKTIEFYITGNLGSDIAELYVGEDMLNPTYRGSLMAHFRQKTSGCIEPNPGTQIEITKAGRYYYESKRGLISTGFTTTHGGYFDVSSDGTITITQTMKPNSIGVEYEDCPAEECFTVHY